MENCDQQKPPLKKRLAESIWLAQSREAEEEKNSALVWMCNQSTSINAVRLISVQVSLLFIVVVLPRTFINAFTKRDINALWEYKNTDKRHKNNAR